MTWIGGNYAWQYVECTPALAPDQWTAVFTNAPPTATTNTFVHTGAAVSTKLFYRIRAGREQE